MRWGWDGRCNFRCYPRLYAAKTPAKVEGSLGKMSPVQSPPHPHPTRNRQLSVQALCEMLSRLLKAIFWTLIPRLLIWFIWFISFFPGYNWCVWSWRKSHLRTADSCGYPCNIKCKTSVILFVSCETKCNNNPSPFIPILLSILFLTPCECYVCQFGPWVRFFKAPETFRVREAIFSSSASASISAWTSCMKGTSLFISRICKYNNSVILRFEILLRITWNE